MSLITRIAEPIRNYRANKILNIIKLFIEPGDLILSVGDGDGYVSRRIQEKSNAQVQGIDILHFKEYRVQGIPLVIYDGKEIPFADNSFDISAGVFLLHHCQNLELTLQEMIRVSKKKIIIFEDVFNNRLEHYFLRFFDTIENRTFSTEMPIPYNFQTLSQWKETFKRFDLKLIYTVQFRALPLPVRNQAFYLVKN
ncbi:MAG: methyltransferase domain-containing protein [Candidatus Heimdallarchaeota archaeon]|nr:MAG: methyltransferase domain-containing protein [Candidatus Heimdallarchaeota archaeon]